MTYSNKLKNPRWQKKRLEIFQMDKWECTNCKKGDLNLQVHHLEYIKGIDPWHYPDDMLTTLCEICHSKENSREKYETELLTSLKINGFLVFDIWHLATKLYTDTRFRDHLKQLLGNGRK